MGTSAARADDYLDLARSACRNGCRNTRRESACGRCASTAELIARAVNDDRLRRADLADVAARPNAWPTRVTKHLRRKGWGLLGTAESNTRPGIEYEIRRAPDGTLGCACMGWAMRKHCTHLDAWVAGSRAEASTKQAPGPTFNVRTVRTGGETFTIRRAISFGEIPI